MEQRQWAAKKKKLRERKKAITSQLQKMVIVLSLKHRRAVVNSLLASTFFDLSTPYLCRQYYICLIHAFTDTFFLLSLCPFHIFFLLLFSRFNFWCVCAFSIPFRRFRLTLTFCLRFQNEITIGYCNLLVLSKSKKKYTERSQWDKDANGTKHESSRKKTVLRNTETTPCTTYNRKKNELFLWSRNGIHSHTFVRIRSSFAFFYVKAEKFICSANLAVVVVVNWIRIWFAMCHLLLPTQFNPLIQMLIAC